MKTLLLLLVILTSNLALAREFKIVARSESNKQVYQKVELEDLESSDSFDGKYFKIVLGKGNEAISFSEREEVLLKAATAYYHLTRARDYFVDVIKSDYVAKLEKIVVRIDITNEFPGVAHFSNDAKKQYNNALTIPEGETPRSLPADKYQKWGKEIWFRPSKKVHLSTLDIKKDHSDLEGIASRFRDQVHIQTFAKFLSQLVLSVTQDNYVLSHEDALRTVGATLFLEFAYRSQDEVNRIFSRKWYWLDSALVPEIIYHEYAHVALSDQLELTHSTPVIEGMADYFAGKIANSPTLAKKIKNYNTFNGKDATRKNQFRLEFETNEWANADFVFGLLWQVSDVVKVDQEIFIYELRNEVSTDSSIRVQLVDGILKTCKKMCDDPFNKRIQLLKLLHFKKM